MSSFNEYVRMAGDILTILGIPTALGLITYFHRQRVSTLKDQLAGMSARNHDMVEIMDRRLNALQEDMESNVAGIAYRRIEGLKSLLADSVSNLERERDALASELDEAKSQLSSRDKDVAELRGDVSRKEQRIQDLESRVAEVDRSLSAARQTAEAVRVTQDELARWGESSDIAARRYFIGTEATDPDYQPDTQRFLAGQASEDNKDPWSALDPRNTSNSDGI